MGGHLLQFKGDGMTKAETLGDLLREWAKAQPGLLTPAKLAKITGYTSSAINKWINGTSTRPDTETLRQIYWKTREYNTQIPPEQYPFGDGILGIPWNKLAALRPDVALPHPDFWTYLEQFGSTLPNGDREKFLSALGTARERYEAGEPPIPEKQKSKTG